MERCDFCELPVGGGCACSLKGKSRDGVGQDPEATSPEPRFPRGAILISPRGIAHRPGCKHQSDSEVGAPVWGWINDPDPLLWRRLNANSPARATKGNTKRIATRRCRNCDT
ncbi:hypothetical protein [Nocardiopsis alkaliphila]|uniref:hypothetical protein n=1 Tax=Nocardiopsis alkaliphila TaxID=225762 RepID=UPI000475D0AB|nr:hypothetical protein [Nocardiopsis alkaliphila]